MGHEFEPLSGVVLSAAVEVHRDLGPGFLETTYAQAMKIALDQRGLCYSCEYAIPLRFKGHPVGEYRLDLVVERSLVVELKAVRKFTDLHFAQLRAYLRASGCRVGLLLNFNASAVAVRRIVQG